MVLDLLDEVAVGNVAFVILGHQQELAALALVVAGIAEVRDIAEPCVVDDPQHVRRSFHHHRAVFEIDPHEGVDDGRVARSAAARADQAALRR